MDSFPISNRTDDDEECILQNESLDRTRISNDYIMNYLQDGRPLRYPKNHHPFKIRTHITEIVLIIIGLLVLFGVTFTFPYWMHYKSSDYTAFGFTGLFLFQCATLLIFYHLTDVWLQLLIKSGFYNFPIVMSKILKFILIFWSFGIFIQTPILLSIKYFCPNQTTHGICLWKFSDYHLMQLYMGIEELVVIILILYYLFKVWKFKVNRLWPDVWHEQLEGTGKILENSPISRQMEYVQLEPAHLFEQALSNHIMHAQAFMINYLKYRNNILSERILKLTHKNRSLPYDQIINEDNQDQTNNIGGYTSNAAVIGDGSSLTSSRSNRYNRPSNSYSNKLDGDDQSP